jgi:hypothetical protein
VTSRERSQQKEIPTLTQQEVQDSCSRMQVSTADLPGFEKEVLCTFLWLKAAKTQVVTLTDERDQWKSKLYG